MTTLDSDLQTSIDIIRRLNLGGGGAGLTRSGVHVHHWLVESPDLESNFGKPCKAVCRGCNATRTFPKHFEAAVLPQYRDKPLPRGFDSDPEWGDILAAALELEA